MDETLVNSSTIVTFNQQMTFSGPFIFQYFTNTSYFFIFLGSVIKFHNLNFADMLILLFSVRDRRQHFPSSYRHPVEG